VTAGALVLSIALFLVCSGMASAQTEQKKEGCKDCHAAAADEIKTAGGKHRAVPCIGCHLGHPPTATKAIQNCNRCHLKTRKAHFELEGCLGCHRNPHTPLNISFTDIKGTCVTCHSAQVDELKNNRSRHSAIECSTCHSVHRKFPQCTQCHKPHSAEMVVADCKKCHKAHSPNLVTFAADTTSKDCGACHRQSLDLLSASGAKHASLGCAFCHKEKHRMIPKCQGCHGSPHPAGLMVKFPICGDCHKIAHDLDNWPAVQQKEASKETRQQRGKISQ